MTRAIIVFAHGSRDPLWRVPVEAVAHCVQAKSPEVLVRCAYLELTEPDLATATGELVAQGAVSIRTLPLFLGVGKHAREDLPRLIAQMRTQYPHVHFELLPAVAEYPEMLDLMARIALS